MSLADETAKPQGRALTPVEAASGYKLTPRQIIHWFSPEEWEELVKEWARILEPKYIRVERLGGTNDHGVDIAGFDSDYGFEGAWDCFQCKHYAEALGPAAAFEEMLKIFRGVVDGHYLMPRRYRFLAPRGVTNSLGRLFDAPSKLRLAFVGYLGVEKGEVLKLKRLDSTLLPQITKVVEDMDFSIFNSVDLADVVDALRASPSFAQWFGGGLPPRPTSRTEPPESPDDIESGYLQQLIEVYQEAYDAAIAHPADAMRHEKASVHIRRQRVAFYSAESLRVFARDSVPQGTFESLQDSFHDGVIETHERDYERGLDRLTAVLEAATRVQITANALIDVTDPVDRRGICHQLANDDRLRWCGGAK